MSLVKLSSLLLLAMASLSWADAQVAQPSAEATPNSHTPAALPPEPAFAQVRRLLDQGKYDEAITQLQQLSEKTPGAVPSIASLCRVCSGMTTYSQTFFAAGCALTP